MILARPFAVLCLAALAPPAQAEVRQSGPDNLFIAFTEPVSASAAKAYADITQVQRWWSSDHTWSGKASNLSLKPEAGGCFCERWKGGSAEHGRVVMALPGKLLRIEAALGPLQEFALDGILSFWIKTADDGTTSVTVEYRVNGASASGLDTFAPSVDEVIGLQVARLKRYIGTGDPDPPPEPQAAEKDTQPAGAKPAKAKPKSGQPAAPTKP